MKIFIENQQKLIKIEFRSSGKKNISIRKDIYFQAITNILIWISLSFISILRTLFKINFSPSFYTLIIILFIPINSIVNPVIYNLSYYQLLKKQKKVSEKVKFDEKLFQSKKQSCIQIFN